mmetsp:Transcript_8920/g.11827  ORF Transcript_8920/g.11827 Transcript_8920/m.11827 type:complete len:275 (+) Transcript_8920:212-1036(+)
MLLLNTFRNGSVTPAKMRVILSRNPFCKSQTRVLKSSRPRIHAASFHSIRNFSSNKKSRKNCFRDPKAYIVALIGANVGIYFHWNHNFNDNERQFMVDHFAFSTEDVFQSPYRWHTLLLSNLSHDDSKHLIINMSMLWLFGTEAIVMMGAKRFFQLYLSGGVASRLCHMFWSSYGQSLNLPKSLQISPSDKSLGATGAINGVILWTLLASSSLTAAPLPFRSVLAGVGLVYVCKDLIQGIKYNDSASMGADIAQFGGAACGALYYILPRRRFVL